MKYGHFGIREFCLIPISFQMSNFILYPLSPAGGGEGEGEGAF